MLDGAHDSCCSLPDPSRSDSSDLVHVSRPDSRCSAPLRVQPTTTTHVSFNPMHADGSSTRYCCTCEAVSQFHWNLETASLKPCGDAPTILCTWCVCVRAHASIRQEDQKKKVAGWCLSSGEKGELRSLNGHHLAVLEEQEGRHRLDHVVRCHVLHKLTHTPKDFIINAQ
jgi:hypothetical protein